MHSWEQGASWEHIDALCVLAAGKQHNSWEQVVVFPVLIESLRCALFRTNRVESSGFLRRLASNSIVTSMFSERMCWSFGNCAKHGDGVPGFWKCRLSTFGSVTYETAVLAIGCLELVCSRCGSHEFVRWNCIRPMLGLANGVWKEFGRATAVTEKFVRSIWSSKSPAVSGGHNVWTLACCEFVIGELVS